MDSTLLCNNLIQLTITGLEMRMSHWIEAPVFKWRSGPKTSLDLSQGGWHLENYADRGDRLDVVLVQYPDASRKYFATIHAKERQVDCAGKQFTVKEFEQWIR